MIAIVHSIYSQSVHAPALNTGLMDNDAEGYCTSISHHQYKRDNQEKVERTTIYNLY